MSIIAQQSWITLMTCLSAQIGVLINNPIFAISIPPTSGPVFSFYSKKSRKNKEKMKAAKAPKKKEKGKKKGNKGEKEKEGKNKKEERIKKREKVNGNLE